VVVGVMVAVPAKTGRKKINRLHTASKVRRTLSSGHAETQPGRKRGS